MARYAERTTVPSDRSRAEIERTLTRYGADQFMYGWDAGRAMIAFRMRGRHVRFLLPMPDRLDFSFTPTGRERSEHAIEQELEQAQRQRWRALALVVKAKLEAVDSGITTFEDEFLAHVMLPDGQSVGDWIREPLALAYRNGRMPALALPAGDPS